MQEINICVLIPLSSVRPVGSPYLFDDSNMEANIPLKGYSTVHSYFELSDQDLKTEWTSPYGVFQQLGIETGEYILKEFGLKKETNLTRGNHNMSVTNAGESARVFIYGEFTLWSERKHGM